MSYARMVLKINGTERSFICDKDNDSLADVLRNMGLTGTKVGCGKGLCGACNVIVDGKLIRSCTRKMKSVKEYSSVETIEGIGTAEHLHPLQAAWIKYGGVQCGFCTPGFIMSALALLRQNPDPTREEVRDWFQKNLNACRCTGYKPIVDAVMAAAKVMRGEMSMKELQDLNSYDGQVFHTRYPKPTALGKVLGTTDYGADIEAKIPGIIHLAPVMSPVAHGNLLGIDSSEAESMPGVIKVITYKDVKGTNRINFPIGLRWSKSDGRERPVLPDKKVFRRGDIVAVVAARTRREARDAAKKVRVNVQELPAYEDVLDSIKPGAVEIHPGIPNEFIRRPFMMGEDTRKVLKNSAHVIKFSTGTATQAHMPIEPETGQAYIDDDGNVVIMLKTHTVYMMRGFISDAIGVPTDKIRIILNPSGGSFGCNFAMGTPAILATCTQALGGAPVSMTLSYEEHQMFTGKRPQTYSNIRIGCDENGKLTGVELEMLHATGCYTEGVAGSASLPVKYLMTPYKISNGRGLVRIAYTNFPHIVAYRCPTCVQLYTVQEQAVDMLAEAAGIDPMDFRILNGWRDGDVTLQGDHPLVYVVQGIMARMKEKYLELKEHAKKVGTKQKPHGVGVAMGSFNISNFGDKATVRVELMPDGTVTHYGTWEDMGQGADIGCLSIAHETLKPLGLKPDQIHLIMNDTGTCPDSGRAAASRSNLMVGSATKLACEALLDGLRKKDGTYRTYSEQKAAGLPTVFSATKKQPAINPLADDFTGRGRFAPDQSFAGFVAEVEVDRETGKTTVVSMHVITDCGVVTNWLSLEGQGYGAMSHSIGFALSEDYKEPKAYNLIGGGFPYIKSIPDGDNFTVTNIETPRSYSETGGSGVAEGFQSSGHAAVLNAIYNAVGVRVAVTPFTPEKMKEALAAKENGTYEPAKPFDFCSDFNETLDDLLKNPPPASKDKEIAH